MMYFADRGLKGLQAWQERLVGAHGLLIWLVRRNQPRSAAL